MTDIKAGKTYELTKEGPVEAQGKTPTVWSCRRVADFPEGAIATLHAAGFTNCTLCSARIVYNSMRTLDAPKVCMQCLGIQPLPFWPS